MAHDKPDVLDYAKPLPKASERLPRQNIVLGIYLLMCLLPLLTVIAGRMLLALWR